MTQPPRGGPQPADGPSTHSATGQSAPAGLPPLAPPSTGPAPGFPPLVPVRTDSAPGSAQSGGATPGSSPVTPTGGGTPPPDTTPQRDTELLTPVESPQPPRRRRPLVVAAIVAAIALVLCGGGGVAAFLLVRNAQTGDGAADPATAVDQFMNAVYNQQDAEAAADLVCAEARDDKQIAAKVNEVKGYAQTYSSPRFRWDPPAVSNQKDETATVAVRLSMTTGDEKTAEQELTFTVIKKTGWWVCEAAG